MMDSEADYKLGRRVARLRRHWRWILIGTGLCGLAAFAVSLFLPKIYRATTDLLISESKIGPGVELPAWQYATLSTYEPFVDNDQLIQGAIERFHLDRDPYDLSVYSFRRKNILDVRALKSTRLVEISIEFPDARLAADLANYFAQGAVTFNSLLNISDTNTSRGFFAKQLEEATANLAEADRRRAEVRARTRIEDREKALSILLKEKEELSTQQQALELRLVQDDSKAKYLQQALKGEPSTFRLTKSILSDRWAEKAAEKSGDNSDLTTSISEETLNTTREKMRHDFVDLMANVAAEKAGVSEASASLEKVNGEINRLLVSLAQTHSELDVADNDYKLAREAVEVASHNYQSASVNTSSKSQDIGQLAPAAVPAQPVRPRLLLNTLLGALAGFLFLVAAATLREGFREIHHGDWDAIEEDRPIGVSS